VTSMARLRAAIFMRMAVRRFEAAGSTLRGGNVNIGNFTGPKVNATTSGGDIGAEFGVTPKLIANCKPAAAMSRSLLPAARASRWTRIRTEAPSKTEFAAVAMAGQLDDGTLRAPINGRRVPVSSSKPPRQYRNPETLRTDFLTGWTGFTGLER